MSEQKPVVPVRGMPAKAASHPATPNASTYSAAELAQNAPRLFGCSRDVAAAALRYNKIRSSTVDEARKIIKAFAERKIK